MAYLWARTVPSPDPSWDGDVPLVKSWVLRNVKGKPIVWVNPVIDRETQTITYEIKEGGTPPKPSIDRGVAVCIATGTKIENSYIVEHLSENPDMSSQLAVIVKNSGKTIYCPPTDSTPVTEVDYWTEAKIPDRALGFSIQRYGITRWLDLFTSRQLAVLNEFCLKLRIIQQIIEKDSFNHGLSDKRQKAIANSVVTYLSICICKLADYNSNICTWHISRQNIRNTFPRQTVAMTWDFVESNPFSKYTGSWEALSKWVIRYLEQCNLSTYSTIEMNDVETTIAEFNAPAIITDPPYYDNISYAALSDFFYTWHRKNLQHIYPDLFSTSQTPKMEELIADPYLRTGKKKAKEYFEKRMSKFFTIAYKHHSNQYPFILFYAYRQVQELTKESLATGWEVFLAGLNSAGWRITATWPLRTELTNRPRAFRANALATSVVIACRKRFNESTIATRREFLSKLHSELPSAVELMQECGVAPVDMAQAAIGPGMAIFSGYSKVVETDGSDMSVRDALAAINEVLENMGSEEEAEFDAETQWSVVWYTEHGFEPGEYGQAETLARAKNLSVSALADVELVNSSGGKVGLIRWDELDPDSDLFEQSKLTIWGITIQMLRSIDGSSDDVIAIIRKVGIGLSEQARTLAYRLYQIADRESRSEEAYQFNMLAEALPRLISRARGSEQTSMDI